MKQPSKGCGPTPSHFPLEAGPIPIPWRLPCPANQSPPDIRAPGRFESKSVYCYRPPALG